MTRVLEWRLMRIEMAEASSLLGETSVLPLRNCDRYSQNAELIARTMRLTINWCPGKDLNLHALNGH